MKFKKPSSPPRSVRTRATGNAQRATGWRVIMTLSIASVLTAACDRGKSTQNEADSTAARTDSTAATPDSTAVRAACVGTAVTSQAIGPAGLGMRLEDLRKLCPVRDSALRAGEGQPANGYAISVGADAAPLLLLIDEANQRVRQIGTADRHFRSGNGVGVGSTVAELRGSGGRLCGGLGPTGIEIWTSSLPGAVFGTTAYPPAMPRSGTGLTKDASAVPDSAHITTVSISKRAPRCESL